MAAKALDSSAGSSTVDIPPYFTIKKERTAWYKIKPGMFISKDLKDAVNTFPTMFVFTKGKDQGRLGDKTIPFNESMTIFCPCWYARMPYQL